MDILVHGRVQYKQHRHPTAFSRSQGLWRKAKALDFLEERCGTRGPITGHRLPDHGLITLVGHIIFHLHQLAWMHFEQALDRLELPWHAFVGIGIELNRDPATGINLGVFRQALFGARIDPGHLANFVIKRHQGKAEPEHNHRYDDEFGQGNGIDLYHL